ncbi:PREDICTED: exocyst complex component 6B-like isoform X2 [Priapulus caudatus]|uniref:Exocyst complex component 6B-like isoform X2 n=1 Tax=Priapulus caudatus TaxID=37621 RepID=A0ABM1E4J4_PRICU|nr:PREDICTED: exocyst complex component 6B-like isoform X2 [Priapulus caudatus]
MYGKLKKQMDCKRYYPALKTLEQLEHTYLPRVSEYRFTKVMYDQIVRLRDGIKEASMSDLKDFLENIRKYSSKIGEVAMQHVADQHGLDPTFVSMPEKKRKAPPPPNPFTGEAEATVTDQETNIYKDGDEELSAQELVDFSPVYRCWHIYNVLGAGEEFESYYRKQRKKQAKLCLQPATNMHETLDGYKKYFHEIIGFFVVEDNILHTTTGLITSGYLDELWEMALSKIVAVLRTHSAYCTDPSLMLDIKILIIFFCHTLEGYGFPVTRLYGLLIEIRDQYNEILMKRWKNTFMDIFEDDNYTPITLHYQAEYTAIVTIFPFKDEFVEKSPFPKRFPFSEFVPRVYQQVKEYIYACLKFSEDLNLSQAEIDDMVRKSTNFLLTRTLSGCLSSLIRRPGLGLAQLIQIAINTEYLEIACIHLEEFISSITGISREATHVAKLQGKSMFKDARSHAEQQIYLALNHKIDEFMELANYEWTLVESKGHASGYLMDLVAFLQSTFMSFTNLPDKVAQTACMSACKHIAESITNLLLDHDTKILSAGAIQQVNLDVIQCEQFASLEPVPGFTVGALQMTFSELRQIPGLGHVG